MGRPAASHQSASSWGLKCHKVWSRRSGSSCGALEAGPAGQWGTEGPGNLGLGDGGGGGGEGGARPAGEGVGPPPATPETEARGVVSEGRALHGREVAPLHLRGVAPLPWASPRREVITNPWPEPGSARLHQFQRGPSPAQRGFKRPPYLRRGGGGRMEEDQSKVFGARRHSDSCFRTGFPNVPGLSKAKGVCSNDSLSSCIIILHFFLNL